MAQALLADAVSAAIRARREIVAAVHQIPEAAGLPSRRLHVHQLSSAVGPHKLLRVSPACLHRSPARTGISDGAIKAHADPELVSTQSRSNPPDPPRSRQSAPPDRPTRSMNRRPRPGSSRSDVPRTGRRVAAASLPRPRLVLVDAATDAHRQAAWSSRRHGWTSGCMRLWPTAALVQPPKLTRELQHVRASLHACILTRTSTSPTSKTTPRRRHSRSARRDGPYVATVFPHSSNSVVDQAHAR